MDTLPPHEIKINNLLTQRADYGKIICRKSMLPTLYSRRTDGSVQTWNVEVQDNKYRTISGIQNGSMVTSEWTVVEGKNIGRSNETTPDEQAAAEALAKWQKKKDNKYSETIDNIEEERPFQPMLAKDFDKLTKPLFNTKGNATQVIFSQPKLDGIRCIATAKGLFSRNGKQFVSCPHIEASLKPLFDAVPNLILDGEFYNPDLAEDFNKICSCVKRTKPTDEDIIEARQIQYHIYDIPSSDNCFGGRAEELEYLSQWFDNNLELVETSQVETLTDLDTLYGEYVEKGFEGQMVRLDKPYENKRSGVLLKRKEFQDGEFLILDFAEGTGNRSGTAGYAVVQVNGSTQRSNIKGNRDYVRELLNNKDNYIGKLATIRYFNITPDGFLRFPYIVAIDRASVEG